MCIIYIYIYIYIEMYLSIQTVAETLLKVMIYFSNNELNKQQGPYSSVVSPNSAVNTCRNTGLVSMFPLVVGTFSKIHRGSSRSAIETEDIAEAWAFPAKDQYQRIKVGECWAKMPLHLRFRTPANRVRTHKKQRTSKMQVDIGYIVSYTRMVHLVCGYRLRSIFVDVVQISE